VHLQEIFFFNLFIPKNKSAKVSITIGILKKSSSVKYVNTPLDIPKNINKNAGKQHSVDKRAVSTAPIIGIFILFTYALVRYSYKRSF
jgi:hypothetical protein